MFGLERQNLDFRRTTALKCALQSAVERYGSGCVLVAESPVAAAAAVAAGVLAAAGISVFYGAIKSSCWLLLVP